MTVASRARFACVIWFALGAAIAIGCARRPFRGEGSGTLIVDGGPVGGAGGAGAGGEAGSSGGVGGQVGTRQNGTTCGLAGQCASGFCIQGICCDRDCSGGCVTCQSPGNAGTCVNRPSGDPPGTLDCQVRLAQPCGNDGTCDGAGGCRRTPAGTLCGGGACDGNAVVGAMACDGRGACVPAAVQICVPYTCNPLTGRCRDNCLGDADCVGTYCETSSRCHVSFKETCVADSECASGFCAGGTCCNTACTAPCMACNLPNHEGACTPRSDCTVDAAATD
jgi:hypothetical protein